MKNLSTELDRAFQALADPTRRAVIARLANCRSATVTELAAPFSMGLPAFLKHLRVLEVSGLIVSTKSGRVRTCSLERERLAEAERWLAERRTVLEAQLDRFADHVESLNCHEEIKDARNGDDEARDPDHDAPTPRQP
ncbi:MAG: metalloregulator ArsR/SmtB family transcription factor [Thermomicrobiales bacterium]